MPWWWGRGRATRTHGTGLLSDWTKYAVSGRLIKAIYGAVLSTANSLIQFFAWPRDRVDVFLKVQKNMIEVDPRRGGNMKMTLISAVNKGKRPVTIRMFYGCKMLGATRYPSRPSVAVIRSPAILSRGFESGGHAND